MALSTKRPSKGKNIKDKMLQDVTEQGGKKKILNIPTNEELHKRIKLRAVEEGRSITEITTELWLTYLNK